MIRAGDSTSPEEEVPPDSSGSAPPEDLDSLVSEVYEVLHRLAGAYLRRQRTDHTLQTTALVHEAYLRLSSQKGSRWRDRHHFYCVAAKAMRQVLINHERERRRLKRVGGGRRVSLEEAISLSKERPTDLVALDEALKDLGADDARKSQIVELRYFGGLSIEETAEVLEISAATVKRDWTLAKVWLLDAMSKEHLDGR